MLYPSPWEARTGGLLQLSDKSGLCNEFEANMTYIVRPFLKNNNSKLNAIKKYRIA